MQSDDDDLVNFPPEEPEISKEFRFHLDELSESYKRDRPLWRSFAKGLIGVTLIGGLALWGATQIVPDGHVALRKTGVGRYRLLPPGRYSNLPGEEFIGEPLSLAHHKISLGSINIITVKQGQVGISYLSGKLIILPTGQHILTEAYHTFDRFVSLKRETMRLDDIYVNTRDNVAIKLQPDVVYKIEDPLLAVNGIDDIEQTILDTATMTMSKVIGSHKLHDIMTVTGGSLNKKQKKVEDLAQHSMSELIYELEESLSHQLSTFGVHLIAIGIRGYDIVDKQLSAQLAQSAVIQANINAQLQSAENEARVIQIQAEAKKQASIKQAEGEAESATVKAQGIFDAAIIIGQSEVAVQMTYNTQRTEMVSKSHKSTLFYLPENGSTPNL